MPLLVTDLIVRLQTKKAKEDVLVPKIGKQFGYADKKGIPYVGFWEMERKISEYIR